MGSIYKITNTVNGKAYIGQTIRDAEKTRIRAHLNGYGNEDVKKDIEKYGKDAFIYEILYDGIIPEFLDDYEREEITKHNTVAPHGYNQTNGGSANRTQFSEEALRKISMAHQGKKLSEEHRQKLSKANMGKRLTDETQGKMSESRKGAKNPMYGKPRSDEAKQKMSEDRKGRPGKPHSEETKRKISEAHKRPDARAKRSEAMKGENNPMYGKSPSESTRRKMSEARKGKPRSTETKRKISETQRIPEYNLAREFFLSLSADMALAEKRHLLYQKFTNVHRATIRCWTAKWTKDS